ncbi:MAG: KEOPS complex subunit Pcc1 [Promethearchaeota archaeon]
MSKENIFSVKSIIELKFNNRNLRDFAYNSFLPELNKSKSWRSTITMEKADLTLVFSIESTDITAYRAAINDIISLGKIIESTLKLTE